MRYILHSITEIDLAMKGMETFDKVRGFGSWDPRPSQDRSLVGEFESDVMKRDPRIVARKLQPSREDQGGVCSPRPP